LLITRDGIRILCAARLLAAARALGLRMFCRRFILLFRLLWFRWMVRVNGFRWMVRVNGFLGFFRSLLFRVALLIIVWSLMVTQISFSIIIKVLFIMSF
jgi:hypothetical protein